jgi:hypothetical protein
MRVDLVPQLAENLRKRVAARVRLLMRIKVVQLLDQRDMIAVNRGQADPDREFRSGSVC